MKKLLAFLVFSILSINISLFAQDAVVEAINNMKFEELKTTTQVFNFTTDQVREIVLKGSTNPYETESFDNTCTVRIEYMPSYDEARVYYECNYSTYDQGQAVVVLKSILSNFMKEMNYLGYSYIRPDKDKFFRTESGKRVAQFCSTLKFKK